MADNADAAGIELTEPAEPVEAAPEAVEPDSAAEGHPCDDVDEALARPRRSHVRLAMAVGLVTTVALAGLAGWLGFRAYQWNQTQHQRALFVAVARQGAVNLTTIDYNEADADVQRILNSATGGFYDDFSKRSQPFVDVLKQTRSKSEGTVTEAGLESQHGDTAQVLVAVTVKTANAGAQEQAPRLWRMRIGVQRVGDGAKVSNVEFVP